MIPTRVGRLASAALVVAARGLALLDLRIIADFGLIPLGVR